MILTYLSASFRIAAGVWSNLKQLRCDQKTQDADTEESNACQQAENADGLPDLFFLSISVDVCCHDGQPRGKTGDQQDQKF